MSAEDEHVLYAQAFGHDSAGYPVFNPPDADFLKPGSIGYFNNIGEWMPLDIPSWSEFLKTMKSLAPQPETWPPKLSRDVTQSEAGASANVSIPNIPLNVASTMTYKSNSDFSAVLLTTYPVTKERFTQDVGMDQWVLENASLIEKYDDVKTYGLWIVTQTYSTPACAINVSTSMGSEIVVAFDAKAPVVAGASANSKWYTDRRDTNWRYMEEQGKKYVVFIAGRHYKYTPQYSPLHLLGDFRLSSDSAPHPHVGIRNEGSKKEAGWSLHKVWGHEN